MMTILSARSSYYMKSDPISQMREESCNLCSLIRTLTVIAALLLSTSKHAFGPTKHQIYWDVCVFVLPEAVNKELFMLFSEDLQSFFFFGIINDVRLLCLSDGKSNK